MNKLRKIFLAFSRKEKVAFLAAAVVFSASAIALAVLWVQATTRVIPTRGGEYVEGVVGQPTYVNPVLAASEADRTLVHLLFANLEQLADKIEPLNDGRTWRVRLKENLRWSDDQKITSDDVIFTVQKIQDPETKSPFFSSWQGVSANRLSELEVQFNLTSPYPFFADNLRNFYPLPKHLFADTPSANWRLSEYNLKPVSSGPYVFAAFEKQANGFLLFYRLAANPRFPGGEPLIEQFTVKFFPKPEDLMKAFNTGLVDGFATLDPHFLEEIHRPYALHTFPLPSYYAVFLNQTQNLVLRDPVVRHALNEGVDRKELVEQVFDGRAVEVRGPVPLFLLPQEDRPASSTAEISAELEAAGWRKNEDGVRAKTEKNTTLLLEFNLTVPRIPFLEAAADRLAARWTELGFKVNLIHLSPEETVNRAIKNREYQALLFGNILNPAGDFYSFWHTNERFHPGLNLSLYSNRQADELIERARREFEAEKRTEALAEFREVIAEDNPAIFLFSPNLLMASSKDLKGLSVGVVNESPDRFLKVSEWHVKTARALKQ